MQTRCYIAAQRDETKGRPLPGNSRRATHIADLSKRRAKQQDHIECLYVSIGSNDSVPLEAEMTT